MSIELCVLASGSAGNCSIVRTPAGVMLIDAGIGPRAAGQRMQGTGVVPADVSVVVLTHLDRDHFSPTWAATLTRNGATVYCHSTRIDDLRGLLGDAGDKLDIRSFDGNPFHPIEGLWVRSIHLQHDQEGSHGFVLEGFGNRIGYATDLGSVPRDLLQHFCDLDLLALESNYDRQMQLDSTRPGFLKQRIMGGHGHLSNEQAFDAVRQALDQCERRGRPLPRYIVLLHRSRQCNCPKLVRRAFCRDVRIGPRLVLAEQYERTDWLRPGYVNAAAGEQLMLAWG
jgi:phosphoribosyl 1,2-cyclic phosphodiesterase